MPIVEFTYHRRARESSRHALHLGDDGLRLGLEVQGVGKDADASSPHHMGSSGFEPLRLHEVTLGQP